MNDPILELVDLAVPFGEGEGLTGVRLELARGGTLGLVGPSGSGKSTLLRCIAGLAPLRGGSIRVGGREVSRLPPERREVVYMHQQPVLFPHLTVGENVAFPLRLRGRSKLEQRDRARELLRIVDLDGAIDRPARELSGGESQRVALARAVAAEPTVLLLDEPFSALDPGLRDGVREAVQRLRRERGLTLVLATHDLAEGGGEDTAIAVLLSGGVRQIGPLPELLQSPNSPEVARFLGFRNELPAHLHPVGTVVAQGLQDLQLSGPGRVADMGLGPAARAGARAGAAGAWAAGATGAGAAGARADATHRLLFRRQATRLSEDPQGAWTLVEVRHTLEGAVGIVKLEAAHATYATHATQPTHQSHEQAIATPPALTVEGQLADPGTHRGARMRLDLASGEFVLFPASSGTSRPL